MKRRPDKTAQTKADLKQAFWRLYAERPIEKITVGQVCELAGYNRGTFYLHFHDIFELLACIEDTLLDGMTDCVESCMRRLRKDSGKLSCIAACKDVVLYYEQNKPYISVLLSEQGDPSFIFRLKNNLKPLWREYVIGVDAGRSEAEIDLLLEYALAGTLFMISRWLSDPRGVSARELAHLVYDYSIKGIR
ncbi:MAG: TetR/AcrR family transcriptional regulator [Eggerthellaceae bacterium]|nr:TetR/AcrR family transcriptional regulator [Eggerthellaceae bacterium]